MSNAASSDASLDVKRRLVSDHLWYTAVEFVMESSYPQDLYFATYFWIALLYSVRAILIANDSLRAVVAKFPMTLSQFTGPEEDHTRVIEFRDLTFKTMFSSHIDATSEHGMLNILKIASKIRDSDTESATVIVDPQDLTEYALAVLDATDFVAKLFPAPTVPATASQAPAKYQSPPPPVHNIQNSNVSTNSASSISTPKKRSSTFYAVVFLVVILLAGAIALIAQNSFKSNNPQNRAVGSSATTQPSTVPSTSVETTEYTEATEIILEPAPIPGNGEILSYPADSRVAPLELQTDGTDDYFFILLPIDGSNNKMKFYVHGGTTVEVLVPLGNYEIYYATGFVWYGEDNLFGPETLYQKFDDTFLFDEDSEGYNGWTVKFKPTTNGNLDSDVISASNFPA